ncbi:T9SS type A sorting domain-containing protein, partial [Lutibacter sp.]
SSPVFNIDVKHGDLVEVKTAVSCEGVYSKTISLINEIVAYPNPTKGSFNIALPISEKEVVIALYTIQSQLISIKTYPVINGSVQLNLKNQPTGLYIVKLQLDKPVTLKIIKQ